MKQISRRDFIKGSLAGMAVGVTVLAGCSAEAPETEMTTAAEERESVSAAESTTAENTAAESTAAESTAAEESNTGAAPEKGPFVPEQIAETYDCDVVIVGGGLAGLAAAVQAGENGLKTVVLEKGGTVGGNGKGVEGIFGCNTSAQKELNIPEMDPGEIIRHELSTSQYFPNGVLWTDLVHASVDNYEWLKEQGVTFSGRVDAYGGLYETMHWFEGDMAAVGYVPAMEAKAAGYGVEFLMDTSGKSLIFDGSQVSGIYAQRQDGSYIQVNAGAVILATGGFGSNDELLKRWGFSLEHLTKMGSPNNAGDGILMALEVGAEDCIDDACFLCAPDIDGIFGKGDAGGKLGFGGPFLWVNGDGDRFVNEDLASENLMGAYMPAIAQRNFYCVADSSIINTVLGGPRSVTAATDKDAFEEFYEAVDQCPSNNIYQADTLEELAEKFGMKPETLTASVTRYNGMCEAGKDSDFAKDPSALLPIVEAPYYMFRMDPGVMVAIGGLGTNRNMQVTTPEGEPIPGLYAIGTDGVRLYRKVYPINIGATCCANNVHSGRVAIRHITENL